MSKRGYQGTRKRYRKHRIPGTTLGCALSGREERGRELYSMPWPKEVHFEDAEKIEKPMVSKLDHEVAWSFCGNSAEMALGSPFAEKE